MRPGSGETCEEMPPHATGRPRHCLEICKPVQIWAIAGCGVAAFLPQPRMAAFTASSAERRQEKQQAARATTHDTRVTKSLTRTTLSLAPGLQLEHAACHIQHARAHHLMFANLGGETNRPGMWDTETCLFSNPSPSLLHQTPFPPRKYS